MAESRPADDANYTAADLKRAAGRLDEESWGEADEQERQAQAHHRVHPSTCHQ